MFYPTHKAATPVRATLLFTIFLSFLAILPTAVDNAHADTSRQGTVLVRQ